MMSSGKMVIIIMIIGYLLTATTVSAGTYTPIALPDLNADISTWSDGGRYNTVFPGDHAWNGVPFSLANDGENNKVYMGTMDIPVNVFGVTSVYTIMNSAFGSYGADIGDIEFFGTGGSYYRADIVEGYNIRDHYYGYFNNVIDGVTAVPAFTGSAWQSRLDMQIFNLSAAFTNDTLGFIRFTGINAGNAGNPFIAATTVEANTVPVPAALWLFGSGLVGILGLRRR